MADKQFDNLRKWAGEIGVTDADGTEVKSLKKPIVPLPGSGVTIMGCASDLFGLIAPTKTVFVRGGAVMALHRRDDGLLALDVLRAAAARSLFEKYADLMAWRVGPQGKAVLKPTTCPHDMAEALLCTAEARTILPYVDGLINCPILRVENGQALSSGTGYDPITRLLVTGGCDPAVVELSTAVAALKELIAEFDFRSDGDKARAVASMISPGLKMGRFISGRVPADVAEADKSQSGKTFRQRVLAAIYNENVSLVTCRDGGVGSIDESLSQQLIAGRPFIQLDNFRGHFDSAHLESFLTADGPFPCRVPHRGEITVSPANYFVMMTSNGVDITRDFANRSNIIRIRKKKRGFVFRKYPEGDLLAHVRAQQTFYLGCVFAVIREWFAKGQPRTDETRHSFGDWVQVVDWIVRNLFSLGPVMDGHEDAQDRVSNPGLVWLRSVALAADGTGDLNRELIATDICSLCDGAGIAIPGLRDGGDEGNAKRIVGSVMGRLFSESDTLEVDGYQIVRAEHYAVRDDIKAGGPFTSKTYTVTKI